MPQSQKNESGRVVYPDVFRRTTSANAITVSGFAAASDEHSSYTVESQGTYSTLFGLPYTLNLDFAKEAGLIGAVTARNTPIYQAGTLYGVAGIMGPYYPIDPGSLPPSGSEQGEPMSDNPTRQETREIIDDKLATVEARVDARLVGIEGKIDTLMVTVGSKLDRAAEIGNDAKRAAERAQDESVTTRWTVIGLSLASLAAIIGILAFAFQALQFVHEVQPTNGQYTVHVEGVNPATPPKKP